MQVKHIWFLGAGSGGHLAPNYAIYQELKHRDGGLTFRFLLTNGSLERSYAVNRGLPCYFYYFDRLVRGGFFSKILKVLTSVLQTFLWLGFDRPDLIISTGGYASFPGLVCAKVLRIPYVLIEPNEVAGKVNSWFASGAKFVFSNYPDVLQDCRTEVLQLGLPLTLDPLRVSTGRGKSLLAFGASQGAKSINLFIEKIISQGLINPIHWIVGAGDYAKYKHYNDYANITVEAFNDDMQSAYANARLVICRAGAGTVAEIHAMSLPAIFIPFPNHQDRQQYRNCEYLRQAGCCIVWEDESLPSMISDLNDIWSDSNRLDNMVLAYQQFSISPLQSREKVASVLLKLLRNY